ncbi:OmpA family protein [Vibrio campbellii]|uniref:OmpA family protein n=1 Tax=Vibrio campbellii TaxID=680 RepID=A0AAE9SLX6_9VIBR|nr:OmpA family protein [Vibrio campbellii]UTZ29589.1 OmpA family protein [Vibrio campbellii]
MNYKNTILFALSVFALTPAFAQEAQQTEEPEKGVIDTLVSNGLYFQIGGGLAQFQDEQYKHDNDITSLKYSLGITTEPLDYEIGYRSLSDGNGFDMKGLDILAKHKWPLWRDGGLFAGVGGYVYNADMDKPQLDSPTETSGVAPYLSVGGYYALSEFIDVSVQFDNLFNVSVLDQNFDKKDTKQLRQVNLSLVLHPWSSSSYEPQPIEHIEDAPEEQTVILAENSPVYSYDDASLNLQMETQLMQMASRIAELESYEVVVTGGADSKPEYLEHNKRLAEERAKVVADFLILHGVKAESIRLETSVIEQERSEQGARKVEVMVNGTELVSPQ